MGCRVVTSFHGMVDRAQVRAGEWVVFGCGGIGLFAVNIASAMARM
jgi:D-arabinose 1-dehydrogenase-like Zn-dependent alcohol dehydrogenase